MPVDDSRKRHYTKLNNSQFLLTPLVILVLALTATTTTCSSCWTSYSRRLPMFQTFVRRSLSDSSHSSSSSSLSSRFRWLQHSSSDRRWNNLFVGCSVDRQRLYTANPSGTATEGPPSTSRLNTTTITAALMHSNDKNNNYPHRVYLAVGSNLGNRFQNIQKALYLLCQEPRKRSSNNNNNNMEKDHDINVRLIRTSFLYETAPMYVTNQPAYVNGAVEIQTSLSPNELLNRIKKVEQDLGRNLSSTLRNGPRPIDLDILLYYNQTTKQDNNKKDDLTTANHHQQHQVSKWMPHTINASHLEIPHPRIQEREFVLRPLCDVAGSQCIHPVLKQSLRELLEKCVTTMNKVNGDDDKDAAPPAVRVLPMRPRCRRRPTKDTNDDDNDRPERFLSWNQTLIMGILNVTPDSFSDGGKWNQSVDLAIQHARQMEMDGASIIDVGGESTRPGAAEISIELELERIIPIIQGIRQYSDIPISIDTRRALVARAAIDAGADIVNDVSGGLYDPNMLSTVADLEVPMIIMHMRGTPQTMQNMTQYNGNVVDEVAVQLVAQSQAAEQMGIHKWQQIIDPGIGFAKDLEGNLSLLKHTKRIREAVGDIPMLLGTSRKGFIGKLAGVTNPEDRDYGTIASCVAALCLEQGTTVHATTCNILRVHNVAAARQAALVMDAIRNAPP